MRRTVAPTLLALVCAASLAGCGRSDSGSGSAGGGRVTNAEGAEAVIPALNSFTEEMLSKIDSARDKKAGVAEAQALLDARRDELVRRISAARAGPGAQDAGAKGRWLEAEVDNTDRVHRLKLKYADDAARDPELKARLNRLVADYDAMFGGR